MESISSMDTSSGSNNSSSNLNLNLNDLNELNDLHHSTSDSDHDEIEMHDISLVSELTSSTSLSPLHHQRTPHSEDDDSASPLLTTSSLLSACFSGAGNNNDKVHASADKVPKPKSRLVTLIMFTVAAAVLLMVADIAQFLLLPTSVKFIRTEVVMKQTPQIVVDFELTSATNLFNINLRSSSCQVMYVLETDDDITRKHLTRVDMSDLEFAGGYSMFRTKTTSKRVVINVNDLSLSHGIDSIRSELDFLFRPEAAQNLDSRDSKLLASCQTSLGYVHVPFSVTKEFSLNSMRNEVYKAVKASRNFIPKLPSKVSADNLVESLQLFAKQNDPLGPRKLVADDEATFFYYYGDDNDNNDDDGEVLGYKLPSFLQDDAKSVRSLVQFARMAAAHGATFFTDLGDVLISYPEFRLDMVRDATNITTSFMVSAAEIDLSHMTWDPKSEFTCSDAASNGRYCEMSDAVSQVIDAVKNGEDVLFAMTVVDEAFDTSASYAPLALGRRLTESKLPYVDDVSVEDDLDDSIVPDWVPISVPIYIVPLGWKIVVNTTYDVEGSCIVIRNEYGGEAEQLGLCSSGFGDGHRYSAAYSGFFTASAGITEVDSSVSFALNITDVVDYTISVDAFTRSDDMDGKCVKILSDSNFDNESLELCKIATGDGHVLEAAYDGLKTINIMLTTLELSPTYGFALGVNISDLLEVRQTVIVGSNYFVVEHFTSIEPDAFYRFDDDFYDDFVGDDTDDDYKRWDSAAREIVNVTVRNQLVWDVSSVKDPMGIANFFDYEVAYVDGHSLSTYSQMVLESTGAPEGLYNFSVAIFLPEGPTQSFAVSIGGDLVRNSALDFSSSASQIVIEANEQEIVSLGALFAVSVPSGGNGCSTDAEISVSVDGDVAPRYPSEFSPTSSPTFFVGVPDRLSYLNNRCYNYTAFDGVPWFVCFSDGTIMMAGGDDIAVATRYCRNSRCYGYSSDTNVTYNGVHVLVTEGYTNIDASFACSKVPSVKAVMRYSSSYEYYGYDWSYQAYVNHTSIQNSWLVFFRHPDFCVGLHALEVSPAPTEMPTIYPTLAPTSYQPLTDRFNYLSGKKLSFDHFDYSLNREITFVLGFEDEDLNLTSTTSGTSTLLGEDYTCNQFNCQSYRTEYSSSCYHIYSSSFYLSCGRADQSQYYYYESTWGDGCLYVSAYLYLYSPEFCAGINGPSAQPVSSPTRMPTIVRTAQPTMYPPTFSPTAIPTAVNESVHVSLTQRLGWGCGPEDVHHVSSTTSVLVDGSSNEIDSMLSLGRGNFNASVALASGFDYEISGFYPSVSVVDAFLSALFGTVQDFVTKEIVPTTAPTYLSGGGLYGFHNSRLEEMNTETFSCMKSNGMEFFLPRGFFTNVNNRSFVDPYLCDNLRGAREAGLRTKGIFVYPKPVSGLSPSWPLKALKGELDRRCPKFADLRIWLDVHEEAEHHNWRHVRRNKIWFKELVSSCKEHFTHCGIRTSRSSWENAFGSADYFPEHIKGMPLWYRNPGSLPTFEDYTYPSNMLGGWSAPHMKQYARAVSMCDATVSLDWMYTD
jgi:hypothetical protein